MPILSDSKHTYKLRIYIQTPLQSPVRYKNIKTIADMNIYITLILHLIHVLNLIHLFAIDISLKVGKFEFLPILNDCSVKKITKIITQFLKIKF